MAGPLQLFSGSIFSGPITEDRIKKYRNIQWAALFPVILALIFFLMTGNIYLLFLFFLLLIIGVMLPWIFKEILQAYLLLYKEIDDLKSTLSTSSKNSS